MATADGWLILAHPLLIGQLEKLTSAVEAAQARHPDTVKGNASYKLLAALRHLIWEKIPADPGLPEYRQRHTLGDGRKHWFRAKFGNQRFRLFFRYSTVAKTIIFVWVNDDSTLPTYGSRNDAYAAFRRMLDSGNPPETWADLVAASIQLDPMSIES